MHRLLGLASALAAATADASNFLLNRSVAFEGRPVTPLLAYSFRQAECVTDEISADIPIEGASLVLNRSDGIIANCPVRQGFKNAIIGAGIETSRLDVRNAIISQPFTSELNALTTNSGSKAMTIELRFTVDKIFSAADDHGKTFVLLEYGDPIGSIESFDPGALSHQMRLAFIWTNNGNNRLLFEFLHQSHLSILTYEEEFFPVLSKIGHPDYVGNRTFMLTLTVGNGNVIAYLGAEGETLANRTRVVSAITNFVFPVNHVLRVGCTRAPLEGADSLARYTSWRFTTRL